MIVLPTQNVKVDSPTAQTVTRVRTDQDVILGQFLTIRANISNQAVYEVTGIASSDPREYSVMFLEGIGNPQLTVYSN